MHPTLRSLSRLSTREQKRFVRWLESGLYHSRKELVAIARICLAKQGQTNTLEPVNMTADFRRQLSHLGNAMESFYALEALYDLPFAMDRYTALVLEKKRQKPRAEKVRKRALKQLDKPGNNPQEAFLYQFLVQRDQLDENNKNVSRENWDKVPEEVLPFNESLDRLFIFHKLQQACRLAVYGNFYEKEIELPLLENLLKALAEKPEILDHPALQLFYEAYQTLKEYDPDSRKRMVQLLFNQTAFLRFSAGRELFVMLLNHGISQLNKGRQEFLSSNLDLYDIGLKTELLLVNGHLTGITFFNIFFLAIKADRLDWAGKFLQTYRNRLSKRDQESIYNYCLANWHYERQELDEAGSLLVNYVSTGSQSLQLQAKITLIKIYYDQGDFELLESLLNSITVYISRNDKIGYHSDIYLRFIRLTRKLVRSSLGIDPVTAANLRKELAEISVQSLREWLEQRIMLLSK